MITSLDVQHYKSLADIRLDFEPITVLVGPNASGKTNIVDALRFLRDTIVHGLDHSINDRGGMQIIRQFSPTRPYIVSIGADFRYELNDAWRTGHYSLKFSSSNDEIRVESESADWTDDVIYMDDDKNFVDNDAQMTLRRDRGGRTRINDKEFDFPRDRLALGVFNPPFYSGTGAPLAQEISQMRFASVYPNTMREPARLDTERLLREDCANWGSILKGMRQRKAGESAVQRIMELMREVVPGLQQIAVKNVGGYVVPRFLVKNKGDSKAHYLDPIQLSDGTLRLFGILLALYQQPPPTFLALEEPEQTVHPGVLGLLVDAFQEASTRTQLLITTHSPYLLDYFDPDQIKVVFLQDGETRISKMRSSQVETVKEGLMNLSEVMALDGLRPELTE